MNILITGGTGFIGRRLARRLLQEGHHVSVTGRTPPESARFPEKIHYVQADTSLAGPWQDLAAGQDAVVNLAGESIFRRWSPKNKARIYTSRIQTTRNLVETMPRGTVRTLVSASAVGYYGFHGDECLTEETPAGSDFLALLCRDWEEEAWAAREKGVRVVCVRLGIVLGKEGGALKKMLPAFRAGLGGPLGSGRQWFSWIHLEDLLDAVEFLLERTDLEGAFNLCAPTPVRNREFSRTLGRVLHRPAFVRVPGFLVRGALGEMGSVLLEGQRAVPQRLTRAGFRFTRPELRAALEEELQS